MRGKRYSKVDRAILIRFAIYIYGNTVETELDPLYRNVYEWVIMQINTGTFDRIRGGSCAALLIVQFGQLTAIASY